MDWVIHSLRGRADIRAKLDELSIDGLTISIISLAELFEGVYYAHDPIGSQAILGRFLQGVAVLDVDEDVARIFGRERGRLRKLHQMIDDLDLLIAATAIRHGLTLLTNNRRDFERIENLRIVSL